MHRRMLAEGKLSKVRYPSPMQSDGRAAGDKLPKGFRRAKPRRQLPA
jgi:hypothetical protein